MSFPSLYSKTWLEKLGLVAVLLLVRAVSLNAQTGDAGAQGAPGDAGQTQNTNGAAPAATGIDTAAQITENPPLTSLDEPKFERPFLERSYLASQVQVSQGIDSNFLGSFGSYGPSSVTQAAGFVDLEKLWKLHPLDLNYAASVNAYRGGSNQVYSAQSLSVTQRFLWRTGQLALRDSFSFLPNGTFGFGSFGGLGGLGGIGSGGGVLGTPGFSIDLFGNVGFQPRIGNMATVDVTQFLSPRSSITLAGGYGLTDFLGTAQPFTLCAPPNPCFLDSNQTSAQVGYNYEISRRYQVGLSYGFEQFHFPGITAGTINSHVWQILFGYHINSKLQLTIGGGPERVHSHEVEPFPVVGSLPGSTGPVVFIIPLTIDNNFLTGAARVDLMYRISERTSVSGSYMRFVNAGSGLLGGASANTVTFGVNRALNRTWNMILSGGYTRDSEILRTNAPIAGTATTYQYGYGGVALHRQLRRTLGFAFTYQYSTFAFGQGYCQTGRCPNSYGRQSVLVGLYWTPRPLRLD